MEKKMYTETVGKGSQDYAVRNIDKLEAAIKAGDMEKSAGAAQIKCREKDRISPFRSPLGKSDITQFQEMGTG